MHFIYPLSIIILLASCNKDEIIKNGSINGTVFNLTTDKGIGGVKVFLTIKHDKRFGSDEITQKEFLSNTDGSFSFANTVIHSSARYSYELATESESGEGSAFGINGDEVILENDKIKNTHILNVVPKYENLCFQIDTQVHITYPDTIIISIEQKIFHKNIPDLPYGSVFTIQGGFLDCSGNYPMGLWYITIDKTKGGLRTITQDSIYIDWKETKTYTINW